MTDDLTALEILEGRINDLQSKIIGRKTPLEAIDSTKVKSVLKLLHEVDTALIMTLTGREKVAALMKKVDILEKIMDPMFLEANYNLDGKVETILSSELDLLKFNQDLQRLEELKPALESDGLEKLTSVSDRLGALSTDILHFKEDCDKHTTDVRSLVKEYKKAILDLNKLFVDVESVITKLEIEALPKKIIE